MIDGKATDPDGYAEVYEIFEATGIVTDDELQTMISDVPSGYV